MAIFFMKTRRTSEASSIEYAQIHEKRSRFIVMGGHETKEIEQVVSQTSRFNVVEKLVDTPIVADKLNVTDVNNA